MYLESVNYIFVRQTSLYSLLKQLDLDRGQQKHQGTAMIPAISSLEQQFDGKSEKATQTTQGEVEETWN